LWTASESLAQRELKSQPLQEPTYILPVCRVEQEQTDYRVDLVEWADFRRVGVVRDVQSERTHGRQEANAGARCEADPARRKQLRSRGGYVPRIEEYRGPHELAHERRRHPELDRGNERLRPAR